MHSFNEDFSFHHVQIYIKPLKLRTLFNHQFLIKKSRLTHEKLKN
jgi:hypothetical protein